VSEAVFQQASQDYSSAVAALTELAGTLATRPHPKEPCHMSEPLDGEFDEAENEIQDRDDFDDLPIPEDLEEDV
jgi:hypothetical protein